MIEITNETFLKAVFGDEWPNVYVTSFMDDPSALSRDRRRVWGGGDFSNTYLQPEGNQYFTISIFNKDDKGKPRRRKVLFKSCHVIVADDVVEKLPVSQVEKLPPPSYKLKSSKHSQQWGWILSIPETDRSRVENLLEGLVSRGLAPNGVDPGMRGCTRLIRTPNGRNTKKKRVDANFGIAPRCRLIEWNPSVSVSMEELAAPFGIDLGGARRDGDIKETIDMPDHPLLTCGFINVKSVLSPGRLDITCPWINEHSDGADDGSALFLHEDGAGFKCHHGHCENKNIGDVIEWIEERSPGFEQQMKAWQVRRSFDNIIGGSNEGIGSNDGSVNGSSDDNTDGVNSIEGSAVATFLSKLPGCTDGDMVEAFCKCGGIGVDDVWRVEKVIQGMLKEFTGNSPKLGLIRGWFKPVVGNGADRLPDWAVGWCYLTHQALYYNDNSGELISRQAFNTAYMVNTGDGGLPTEVLAGSGVIPIFWNQMYLPGAEREFMFEGSCCINSFKGYPSDNNGSGGVVDSRDDDRVWDMVVTHAQSRYPIKWFVLLDYLSWCVQNPGKKVLWMPILQGVPGDGKSYWGKMMQYVLGNKNVVQISTSEIQSNFSDWAVGGMFGIIEEIRIAGHNRFETVDKLKPYITNDYINVLPKGLRGYTAPNVMNYLALTNHKDAVPVDINDRRFLPFFSQFQCAEDLEHGNYFTNLYDQTLHKDAGATVRRKLLERKIGSYFTHWQRPTIEGDTDREEMIELTGSEIGEAIDQYIKEGGILNTTKMKQIFENPMSDYNIDRCSTVLIKRELSWRGYKIGRVERTGGKTIKVWSKSTVHK